MGQVYLGVLRGYSDSTTNEYGNFYMYLNYDSITRQSSGNSENLTLTNAYIQATPVYSDKRWTTNTIYIDSVYIGNTSLGISSSWKGYNSSTSKPRGHTTSVIATKTISGVSRTTTELSVTLYGHRSATSENSQTLTGKITFDAGWSSITSTPTLTITDHGTNKITFGGYVSQGNTNNAVNSSYLYYTTNGQDPYYPSDYTTRVQLTPNDERKYTVTVDLDRYIADLDQDEEIKFRAVTYSYPTQSADESLKSSVISGGCKYYSKPSPPNNLQITQDGNWITITADKGDNGLNNEAVGVAIQYWTNLDPEDVKNYTGPFEMESDAVVIALAWTEGTYKGGNSTGGLDDDGSAPFYWSEASRATNSITTYSTPGTPKDLSIVNNYNNSFTISCEVGNDGDNNSVQGVEIYYTTDGTVPSVGASNKIYLPGSQGVNVKYTITNTADLIVKAIARTKGTVTSNNEQFLYSDTIISSQVSVLYYKTPIIQKPVISYDKKLTKKSNITIDQNITLYKNTKLEECKIYLYKDSNDNALGDDNPLLRTMPVLKFPYQSSSQESSYPCSYITGSVVQKNGVIFTVGSDGLVSAQFDQSSYQTNQNVNFNLNDSLQLNTINGINLIIGQTYKIQDCVMCYRLKNRPDGDEGWRYKVSGETITWEQNFTFVAVYISVNNNELKTKKSQIFYPKISYSEDTAAYDIIQLNADSLNMILSWQDVSLNVQHNFNLRDYDLKKDDKIYVKIVYTATNGQGQKLIKESDMPISDMYTLQSNGVMRIKVLENNIEQWYEGQVWVNVEGEWKEATEVFVNVDSSWKESV